MVVSVSSLEFLICYDFFSYLKYLLLYLILLIIELLPRVRPQEPRSEPSRQRAYSQVGEEADTTNPAKGLLFAPSLRCSVSLGGEKWSFSVGNNIFLTTLPDDHCIRGR